MNVFFFEGLVDFVTIRFKVYMPYSPAPKWGICRSSVCQIRLVAPGGGPRRLVSLHVYTPHF